MMKLNKERLRFKVKHISLTNSSSGFPGRLVEPCLDIVLPVLLEMTIRDNIVVLHFFTSAVNVINNHQHEIDEIQKPHHIM